VCIDAILEKKVLEGGIDIRSADAPQSVEAALDRYFPEHRNWDLGDVRRKQAHELQIVASGPRTDTAERIRDKIAASKKKGLWMGGTLPLGYDRHPDPQRLELVLNPVEAETVRKLFDLYADMGNLRLVEIEARSLELRSKATASTSGRRSGGSFFTRGQLHYLLRNPLYTGRIRHKDTDYAGQHPAIIDQDRWNDVQAKLLAAKARPRGRSASPAEARLLTGKLRDETGDIRTPTHTQRHGRRFAYYVSHRLIAGGTDPTGWRLPAEALETTVRTLVAAHLRQMAEQHGVVATPDAINAAAMSQRAVDLATRAATDPSLFASLVEAVVLGPAQIDIRLDANAIARALGVAADALSPALLELEKPFALRRRGVETRIIAGETEPRPDPVLVRTLAEARAWAKALRRGNALSEIAASTKRSEPYIRTRIPLAFLAPQLQIAILEGRQSADLSVARLIREDMPMDWAEQLRLFG
jgi:site-specific DNA recombinase